MEVLRSNLIEQLKEHLPHQPAFYSKAENEQVLALIKEVVKNRPTDGYRRAHAIVNSLLKEKKLKVINHKQGFRLMRLHHLLLQRPNRHPKRLHTGKVETLYSNTR
ncbi:hypothetical protein PRO82_002214 [Candidatus Protochlamydia amoebophila]|nr:hypothetical protein [Candidatus Protochlamydia amoebophila]